MPPTMHDDERRSHGVAMRRRILGSAHVERAAAEARASGSDFQDLITRYVWGEIWTRDGLDERTRRILVLGTLIALGRWEEFALHVRAAIHEGGFGPDTIKEVVLQQAIYCGVPAAHRAFAVMNETLGPTATARAQPKRSSARRAARKKSAGSDEQR